MGRFYSDTLERAVKLLYFQADASKFPEAVRLLEQAVASEEPDAFYFLARCYAWEDGNVKEDIKKARKLSKRGIELGSDLCILGADRMNELKGELKNAMRCTLREAFDAVLKRAEEGEPMAQYAIGLFYFWGDMLLNFQKPSREEFVQCEQENAKEALKWFRLSAQQGCLPAFRNAFNSVRKGTNGVKKDIREALCWAETVKDKVDMRNYYISMISEYQALKEFDQAVRWCKIGADAGDAESANCMGNAYLNGNKGVPQSDEEAVRWFERSWRGGSPYGGYNLGCCYYNGWGCKQDYAKAFEYFKGAWEMGHRSSLWYLSYCYFWGRGTAEDRTRAFQVMKSLEQAGEDYPKELMGLCYLYGQGVAADHEKGKSLLEQAGTEGTAIAWSHLGDIYNKGVGTPENIEMAVACYQKALDAGYKAAAEKLKNYKKSIFGKWKRK